MASSSVPLRKAEQGDVLEDDAFDEDVHSTSLEATTVHSAIVPPMRISTGIDGFDQVLNGGFLEKRSYLLRGGPGTGKTLLSVTYLAEAAADGKTLYITFGESAGQIRKDSARIGLDLEGVEFLDLSPPSEYFAEDKTYDIFAPAEVEREPTTGKITAVVERVEPERVVIDSMTDLQYLAQNSGQFRKQALGLLQFLTEHGATVIYTAESRSRKTDEVLQFISDGIVTLGYEEDYRSLQVSLLRGSDFQGGSHTLSIGSEGVRVYPRLRAAAGKTSFKREVIGSGVPEVDELLLGGLDRGTVTMITGSSGVGKTTLGLQFMKEAAGRGERSVVFSFEEETETLLYRCESVNMPVRQMVDRGTLHVEPIRPWQMSLDEFVYEIREQVEEHDSRIVMIDTVSGFQHAVNTGDPHQALHMLTRYLIGKNVTVLLTDEVTSITGDFKATEGSISYMADNLIFIRYLEMKGELRKAIGVLKKRTSDFEKTLREFAITEYGIKVGSPLTDLRGILRGTPELSGAPGNQQ